MTLPRYYTVQHLAEIFHRDEVTIRRWISEGKTIAFAGIEYHPEKDPGNNWLFTAVEIEYSSTLRK